MFCFRFRWSNLMFDKNDENPPIFQKYPSDWHKIPQFSWCFCHGFQRPPTRRPQNPTPFRAPDPRRWWHFQTSKPQILSWLFSWFLDDLLIFFNDLLMIFDLFILFDRNTLMLMMFDDVWWCLMMFDDVWWCLMMFDDVWCWWCLMIFDHVW